MFIETPQYCHKIFGYKRPLFEKTTDRILQHSIDRNRSLVGIYIVGVRIDIVNKDRCLRCHLVVQLNIEAGVHHAVHVIPP